MAYLILQVFANRNSQLSSKEWEFNNLRNFIFPETVCITGYTSMSYLARLPIDVIKIDKSLVRNINENNNLKSIVKAIVTMSKSLGMKNIFEGIETTEELSVIKAMKGNIIQGFLFSKPIMADDIDHWLSFSHDVNQAKILKF